MSVPRHSNPQPHGWSSACADLSLLLLGCFRHLKAGLRTEQTPARLDSAGARTGAATRANAAVAQLPLVLYLFAYLRDKRMHTGTHSRAAKGVACLRSQSHFTEHQPERGEAPLPTPDRAAGPAPTVAGVGLQVPCLSFPVCTENGSGHGLTNSVPCGQRPGERVLVSAVRTSCGTSETHPGPARRSSQTGDIGDSPSSPCSKSSKTGTSAQTFPGRASSLAAGCFPRPLGSFPEELSKAPD